MLGASTLSPSQAITLTPDSRGKRALFTIHCHTLNLSTHFGVAHPKAGDDGPTNPAGVDPPSVNTDHFAGSRGTHIYVPCPQVPISVLMMQ